MPTSPQPPATQGDKASNDMAGLATYPLMSVIRTAALRVTHSGGTVPGRYRSEDSVTQRGSRTWPPLVVSSHLCTRPPLTSRTERTTQRPCACPGEAPYAADHPPSARTRAPLR